MQTRCWLVLKGGHSWCLPFGITNALAVAERRKRLSPGSKGRRPFAGGMEDAQDFYPLPAYAIGNDVRCTGNHQFARTFNASNPAQSRISRQQGDGPLDGRHYTTGGIQIVPGNILGMGLEICQRRAQPAHAEGTIGHASPACAVSTCSWCGAPARRGQNHHGLPPQALS